MKNSLSLFSLLLFFIVNSSYSQSNSNFNEQDLLKSNYSERYEKLKKLYINKLNSESFKQSSKAIDDFNAKIDYGNKLNDMRNNAGNGNTLLTYIRENLHKTKFKTYQDAEEEYNSQFELFKKEMIDNKEFYDYLREVYAIDGSKTFADVVIYVQRNHPEIFHY